MNDVMLCSSWYSVLCQRHSFITLRWCWFNKALLYSTWNSAQYYVAAWIGGEFEEEWIHVYVWLSLYTVDLKLLQNCLLISYHFSSIQLLSRVQLFVTPWTAAHQASLSITNSRSSLKLMSIESVMPSSHLILCHPLFLLPSVFPSIRLFSNESALHIRSKVLEFQLQRQSFQWRGEGL